MLTLVVTTSNSSSVSAYLNEVEKWVFQLRPSISDLEQALKTKEEECDVLAKALKESEERRETQHVSMVAELAAAVSKMNSAKEAKDAAMEEAKSSMRHLAVAEGNVRRVKEENEKLEGEIRKLKKENEKLESLAVTVEKKCKEVWGILESRR